MHALHASWGAGSTGSPAPGALMAPRCANGTTLQLSICYRSSEDKSNYKRKHKLATTGPPPDDTRSNALRLPKGHLVGCSTVSLPVSTTHVCFLRCIARELNIISDLLPNYREQVIEGFMQRTNPCKGSNVHDDICSILHESRRDPPGSLLSIPLELLCDDLRMIS